MLSNPFKRKLTLREMHQLYLLLKPFLPKEEKYLIHEIIKIMEKISPEAFIESMKILHGKNFDFNMNPGELVLKFVKGIKENNLFSYVNFVSGINNGK